MELNTFAISRLNFLTLKYRILRHPLGPALG